MPQFNPHNYMDPNPGYRTYNGEYYLYTPTKTQDWSWGASGIGGKVEKLTPEQVKQYGLNANNTYNAVISPEQWVANAAWTQQDFQSGIQNAFGGFDKNNTTGWQGKMNELVSQAQSLYNQDPSQGDKVFGTVWNNFRNSNLPAIQNLQAQNNPARPEFTSQTQAGMYGQTGQLMNQDQINAYARNGGQPQQSQPVYTGPTTTRLNPQTGLLEKVPASSVLADQLPLAVSKTITPDQLTNSTNTAGLFPSIANGSAGAQTVLNVGNLGLSALDQALLQFNAQQQELAASQRSQAETALAQAQQGLANVYNTSREGEIARILQEAGIKEKQAALSDLKVKMAQAQEALNLGLQQENGRIAPMSIIGRRQQLLVEQAQGKIGALAAIANVYADDLDQAWNVANLTIDAMNQDRQEKIDAYQFLIKANENKIVSLKAEEKEAIDSQIKILKDAQAAAEENKDKVMALIASDPLAAQKGKVSLTDSYETVFEKMMKNRTPKTEVREIGTRTYLINSETGEKIKDLGYSGPTGGGGGQTGTLGLTNQQIDNIAPLMTQFQNSPIVKNYNTLGETLNFVSSLSNSTQNPTDDQALIYSIAKALDPDSVVREGEYATVQKYAQSWAKAYGKSVNQAFLGTGFLSEAARKNIKQTLETRFRATEASYNNLYNETQRRINLIGNTNKGDQLLNNYGGAFKPVASTNAQAQTAQTQTQTQAPATQQGFWSKAKNWLFGG